MRHRSRHLITNPKEIAERTGLDVRTVKKSLSMTAGRSGSARVVVVRVGGTDVVVRLID